MNNKQKYSQYINEVIKIASSINFPTDPFLKLEEEIETTELIIPLVGGFSAGKSSLINSFLGRDVLPVAITPETSLATELRYSVEDYIEAVDTNGAIKRHTVEEFDQLKDDAKNIQYLRLYLNHERLKAIQPLVLVDMPGFDSPIENHNQAIFNYLNRGVYFVFLTSVEDGTIASSMRREIDNLQTFGKGFSFCVSKTNLRSDSDVKAVQSQISDQLSDYFDYTQEVVLLGEDGGSNLDRILTSIDPNSLLELVLLDPLKNSFFELEEQINTKASTFKTSKEEAEKSAAELQKGLRKIVEKKEAAIRELEGRSSHQMVERIADRVVSSLSAQRELLVTLAMESQEAFSREINEIIKNSLLISTQEQLSNLGSDIIKDISFDLSSGFSDNLIVDSAFIERVSTATSTLLHHARGGLADFSDTLSKRGEETGKGLWKAIASIVAITTTIVSPIIELIIVFLPDIISLFTQTSSGSREQQQRVEIERKLVTQIFPSIRSKICEALPAELNKQLSYMIEEISKQFEGELEKKRVEIEAASAEKESKAGEIENELIALNAARKELNRVAKQYLYQS